MNELRATRRLFHVGVLVAAASLWALFQATWQPAAAMIPLLGALLFAFLEILLPMPRKVQRTLDLGDRVLLGDEVKVQIRLEPAPLPQNIVVDDGVPEGFIVPPEGRQAPRPVSRQEAVETYTLKPRRRGEYDFDDAIVRRTSLLGLFERAVSVPAPGHVTVLPASAKQVGVRVRPRPLPRAGIITRQVRRGPGDEFFALREYLPGDSLGDINWKATARTQRIITNEFLPEEPPRYLLYVDARQVGAEVGTEDAFERTLLLAAVLVEALIDARAHVGLVLLSYHSVFLVPAGGASQLRRLQQMILDARPGHEAPLIELVNAGLPHLPSRADAILMTPNVYDATLGSAVTFLRTHHGRVSVLAPGFPEPTGINRDATARRAAGALLNAEQATAIAGLRPYADAAVQWPPDEPVGVTLSRLGLAGRTR